MSVHRYKDLIVWQLANTFKLSTYELLRTSPQAQRNFKFKDQLEASASAISKHIAEGFLRFSPRELVRFLGYALSSLGEAEGWIQDGIDRGYFKKPTALRCSGWRSEWPKGFRDSKWLSSDI